MVFEALAKTTSNRRSLSVEDDHTSFHYAHPNRLPFFADPLEPRPKDHHTSQFNEEISKKHESHVQELQNDGSPARHSDDAESRMEASVIRY
jgi:hypothetical protein